MMVAEALECLGGNGYVEESGMPLLFRESPLNSIWEGSGNVNALDVLRALGREPEVLEAWLTEVGLAQGEDPRLDRAIEGVLAMLGRHHDPRGLGPPARRPDGGLPAGLAAGAVRSPDDRRRLLRHPARRRLQRHPRHAAGRHGSPLDRRPDHAGRRLSVGRGRRTSYEWRPGDRAYDAALDVIRMAAGRPSYDVWATTTAVTIPRVAYATAIVRSPGNCSPAQPSAAETTSRASSCTWWRWSAPWKDSA